MKKIIIPFLFSIPLALVVFYLLTASSKQTNFVSPLPGKEPQVYSTTNKKHYIVGFLPHWTFDQWEPKTTALDEIILFTFDVDQQGNLEKRDTYQKTQTKKFQKIKRDLQAEDKKLSFSIRLFEDGEIDQLLANKQAQARLIKDIKSVQEEVGFDGVNIDFEYQNNPTAILKQEFFDFLKQLKSETSKHVTVDVFANTIVHADQQMLRKLGQEIDFLVIMAYDFHQPESTKAGPVAPLRVRKGNKSIISTLKTAYQKFPREKLILAFPLYGYEWYTKETSFRSQTLDKPTALASYQRMQEFVEKRDVEVFWDRISGSPWLTYEQDGFTKQIYFENRRSFNLKIDLVKQSQINGLGIWSLGYEGTDEQIWKDLQRKLKNE